MADSLDNLMTKVIQDIVDVSKRVDGRKDGYDHGKIG